ncbi:MAG: hypothetical protein ABJN26_24300 [Stappiaceae bacterium]
MYSEDSFHTLSSGGQIGLLCLSLSLTILVLIAAWRLMRGRPLSVRIAIAIVLFLLFVWLSPQVYYTYYLIIFEGLPLQIVVRSPPGPWQLANLMFFQDGTNLSAHGKGLLGWLLLLLAALRPKYERADVK